MWLCATRIFDHTRNDAGSGPFIGNPHEKDSKATFLTDTIAGIGHSMLMPHTVYS